MDLAYITLRTDELLKEITKWHILQYLQFPNIFLEKLCDDKHIDKLNWLFTDNIITINLLNEFVKYTFTQEYDNFYNNQYYSEHEEFIVNIEMKTFMDYILFFKKCPKFFMYIFNNFPDEKKNFIKLLESKKIQQYMKMYFSTEDLLIMNSHMNINLEPKNSHEYITEDKHEYIIEDEKDICIIETPMTCDEYKEKVNHIVSYYMSYPTTPKFRHWLHDNKQINTLLKDDRTNGESLFNVRGNNNSNGNFSSVFYENDTKTRLNNFSEFIYLIPKKKCNTNDDQYLFPEGGWIIDGDYNVENIYVN